MGWDQERFVNKDTILTDLICTICNDVLKEPVQTPCEHCFCKTCITPWLQQGQNSCPVDRNPLTSYMLKTPNRMTMQLLNDLEIRCKNFTNECSFTTKLDNERNLTLHEIEHCIVTENEKLHIQNKKLRSMISNKQSRRERGENYLIKLQLKSPCCTKVQ